MPLAGSRRRTHSPGEVAFQVVAGTARVQGLGVVAIQAYDSREVGHRAVNAAQLLMGGTPLQQGIQVGRLEADDLAVVLQRRMVLACMQE